MAGHYHHLIHQTYPYLIIGMEKIVMSMILILLLFNKNYLNFSKLKKLKLISLMRKKLHKAAGQKETSLSLITKSYISARPKQQ